MQLTSTAFDEDSLIPAQYTCKGKNTIPPLAFEDVPADTQSLALIMFDPDSPSGDFVHWLTWNIPPGATGITERTVPGATQGVNDFGTVGYGGPCPGSGTHHYIFELYALDTMLSLSSGSKREELLQAINGHQLAKCQLTGLFSAS